MKEYTKYQTPSGANIDWAKFGKGFTPFPKPDEGLPSRWMFVPFVFVLLYHGLGWVIEKCRKVIGNTRRKCAKLIFWGKKKDEDVEMSESPR